MSRKSEDTLVLEELEREKKKRITVNGNSKINSDSETLNKQKNKIKEKQLTKKEKKIIEKQAKSEKKKLNNEIVKTTMFFAILFFAIVGYYLYIISFNTETIVNNSYNTRLEEYAKINVRGGIYTDNYEVIAYTKTNNSGKEQRVYPHDNLFAHVIGMNDHGKTGIEKLCDYYLLTTNNNPIKRMINEFNGTKNIGNDVVTTLNLNLQKASAKSLGKYDGAVVVLDNETGKILSMVSKPDYNPNDMESVWKEIEEINDESENLDKDNNKNNNKESINQNSFLLNRATQGLYTPGSIFKIFTTLEYMRENGEYNSFEYECKGKDTFANYTINCYDGKKHGKENLIDSFANSCNGAFATIGKELDSEIYNHNMKGLLFNTNLPIALEYKKSKFNLNNDSSIFDITQTAIGQGTTLVTPIHMAMVVQAIANDGKMMTPYVVSEIQGNNGAVIKKYHPELYKETMTQAETTYLRRMMKAVVEDGTGRNLKDKKYKAYGKTGTAQIDSGDKVNSWFVGFAEKGKKGITVCVVIESVSDGSVKAIECAENIFDSYFK